MPDGLGTDAASHWGTMQEGLTLGSNAVDGTTLYSPTFVPPDDAALEATSGYFQSGGKTLHGFGFWDHAIQKVWTLFELWEYCPQFFARYSGIDATDGRRYIGVSLWRYGSGGTWPYLYNWQTRTWEDAIDDPCNPLDGAPGYYAVDQPWPNNTWANGWDIWELHQPGAMPVTHSISNNSALSVHQGGVWYYNTPARGGRSGGALPDGYRASFSDLWGNPSQYYTWWIASP